MSRLPRVTGRELVKALESLGFQVKRIRGSHHILVHEDGRRTIVPIHAGEIVGPGLLHAIMRECDIARDELVNLLTRG